MDPCESAIEPDIVSSGDNMVLVGWSGNVVDLDVESADDDVDDVDPTLLSSPANVADPDVESLCDGIAGTVVSCDADPVVVSFDIITDVESSGRVESCPVDMVLLVC